MTERAQQCSAFGGCGKWVGPEAFYKGLPNLCQPCADRMAEVFRVGVDQVYYASFAIECSVQVEKAAHAEAKRLGTEKAAAGTLRMDSGIPESLRRQGQRSFLHAMLKLAAEAPHDRERAAACYAQYEAWVWKMYGVTKK
jgi:hypothetical protein